MLRQERTGRQPGFSLRRRAGLTGRGYLMVVAGAGLFGVALMLGLADFVFLAYLLLVLPVFSLFWLAGGTPAVDVTRLLSPAVVSVGEQVQVSLQVHARSGRPLHGLHWAEQPVSGLPLPNGGILNPTPPEPGTGGRTATAGADYTLTPAHRGTFRFHPLRFRRGDPFGFARREWEVGASATLVVTPAVVPLTDMIGAAQVGGSRPAALSGIPARPRGFLAREYQHGDSFSRVNWSATARRGEIMVREDEAVSAVFARLVLELTPGGNPRNDAANEADAAVELAVTLAAAVGVHLLQAGLQVELVQGGVRRVFPGAPAQQAFLEDLAAAEALSRDAPGPVLTGPGTPALTCLITTAGEAGGAFTALHPPSRRAIAFFTGSAALGNAPAGATPAAGWRYVGVQRASDIPQAWLQALSQERPQA